MSTRRRLIAGLGTSVFPLVCLAQTRPSKVWRIGYLSLGNRPERSDTNPVIVQVTEGLRELGYAQGSQFVLESRWAEGDLSRLNRLAAELASAGVDVILASATPAAVAAQQATRSIPIVLAGTAIAEGAGLIDRLAHPGGNVTGLTLMSPDLAAKKLQFLKEISPGTTRVGVLPYLKPGTRPFLEPLGAAARTMGVALQVHEVQSAAEFDEVFSQLKREDAQALIVCVTAINSEHRTKIIDFAARNRLPAIYDGAMFADDGGLISYAADASALYRRTAIFLDKIFRGTRAGDIPVELPTRFELIINLRTARQLGVTIPQSLLLRADRVIQ